MLEYQYGEDPTSERLDKAKLELAFRFLDDLVRRSTSHRKLRFQLRSHLWQGVFCNDPSCLDKKRLDEGPQPYFTIANDLKEENDELQDMNEKLTDALKELKGRVDDLTEKQKATERLKIAVVQMDHELRRKSSGVRTLSKSNDMLMQNNDDLEQQLIESRIEAQKMREKADMAERNAGKSALRSFELAQECKVLKEKKNELEEELALANRKIQAMQMAQTGT